MNVAFAYGIVLLIVLLLELIDSLDRRGSFVDERGSLSSCSVSSWVLRFMVFGFVSGMCLFCSYLATTLNNQGGRQVKFAAMEDLHSLTSLPHPFRLQIQLPDLKRIFLFLCFVPGANIFNTAPL
ncbi:MAG: hypothetical protein ACK5JD_02280 [Mangrovibacterium sp.]